MAFLINPGGKDDKNTIGLATCKGNRIPNWQKGERAPEAMQAARGIVMDGHEGRVLRSLASTYTCIGMAFANRRTCIEPDQVPLILKEDGFVELPKAAAVVTGDLVVYELDGHLARGGGRLKRAGPD